MLSDWGYGLQDQGSFPDDSLDCWRDLDNPPASPEELAYCAAGGAVRADADFLALKDGYLACSDYEDRALLGLLADRLLDLGVDPCSASALLEDLRMQHPANELPF